MTGYFQRLAENSEFEESYLKNLECEVITLRNALKLIKDLMGGETGIEGWDCPEDVWGIANEALNPTKNKIGK